MNDALDQATGAQDPIAQHTVEQQLRSCGLQVTAQRLAVMEAVAASSHATTEELTEVVRGKIGSISRQSVYDTLGTFADKGLIRRIQPSGSVARYESFAAWASAPAGQAMLRVTSVRDPYDNQADY